VVGLGARTQAGEHGVGPRDGRAQRVGVGVGRGEVHRDGVDVHVEPRGIADHGRDFVPGRESLCEQLTADAAGGGHDGELHGTTPADAWCDAGKVPL
jgi:hypothetical protein